MFYSLGAQGSLSSDFHLYVHIHSTQSNLREWCEVGKRKKEWKKNDSLSLGWYVLYLWTFLSKYIAPSLKPIKFLSLCMRGWQGLPESLWEEYVGVSQIHCKRKRTQAWAPPGKPKSPRSATPVNESSTKTQSINSTNKSESPTPWLVKDQHSASQEEIHRAYIKTHLLTTGSP